MDINTPPETTKHWCVCSDHFETDDFFPKTQTKEATPEKTLKRRKCTPKRNPKRERCFLKRHAVPRITPRTSQVVPSEHTWDEEENQMLKEDNEDTDFDPQDLYGVDSEYTESDSDTDEIDEEDDSDEEDGRKRRRKAQLCSQCGKLLNNTRIKTHKCDDYDPKPYPCNWCGKSFDSETRLKLHARIHKEGYIHRCSFCLKTFTLKVNKIAHEKLHPPVEKPYQCPECPELFARRKDRHNHLKSHGTRHLMCHICDMEFPYRFKLERHMVVHTGKKQFVCEVCQRSFGQESHLKSHMRVHTGEKPYQCWQCEKSFTHNVSLKSHVQRYHGQDQGKSGRGKKKESNPEPELDTTHGVDNDAEEVEQRASDPEYNPEEEIQTHTKKQYRKLAGRPRGRPKRMSEAQMDGRTVENSDADVQEAEQRMSDPEYNPEGEMGKELL